MSRASLVPSGGATAVRPTGLQVPFNRPAVARNQLQRIDASLRSGNTAGNGPFTKIVEQKLSDLHHGSRVLLTPSCTASLEMSALLLNLVPGDEVIVPSFTFVSTANAFALFGAQIRFADVRLDTWTIDLDHAKSLVSERTRAIVMVHYGGAAPDVELFSAYCKAQGISLIEDNAHGLFGKNYGKALGTYGDFSTLSFHETKNISCGEGGAIVIADESYAERAEIVREKGTDRSRFLRGHVDKYTWVAAGSSYLMSDITAASLDAQLDDAAESQGRRNVIWNAYQTELEGWSKSVGARFHDPLHTNPFHLFAIQFKQPEVRNLFLDHCRREHVGAVFHYIPLHDSPYAVERGWEGFCPNTTLVSGSIVRLPIFNSMTQDELDRVITVVLEFAG
jgi:dTDP-4-amino-4,6-dideoxygalactose transaminase